MIFQKSGHWYLTWFAAPS